MLIGPSLNYKSNHLHAEYIYQQQPAIVMAFDRTITFTIIQGLVKSDSLFHNVNYLQHTCDEKIHLSIVANILTIDHLS